MLVLVVVGHRDPPPRRQNPPPETPPPQSFFWDVRWLLGEKATIPHAPHPTTTNHSPWTGVKAGSPPGERKDPGGADRPRPTNDTTKPRGGVGQDRLGAPKNNTTAPPGSPTQANNSRAHTHPPPAKHKCTEARPKAQKRPNRRHSGPEAGGTITVHTPAIPHPPPRGSTNRGPGQ